MARLIAFDLDGPILDSFETAQNSVFKTRQRLIKEKIMDAKKLPQPTKETFILGWGYPGAMAVKKLFPLISDSETKIFIEFWAQNEKGKKIPIVKGAKKTLRRIKKTGLHAALLTTRSHNLKFHFDRFGLKDYFDFFQSFAYPGLRQEKAHPRHIFYSSPKDSPSFFDNLIGWMNQRNISLKEVVFIDDTLTGLKITKKIGLPFLGVCTGPLSSKKDWKKYGNLDGKYVIKSIAELPGWLQKYGRV